MVQTKAPKPRKLFVLDGPFAPCLATVPEEAALATHILCEPAGPAPSPAASTQGGPNNGPNDDSWRHSRLIGDTDSKRLAGYLGDPAKSPEMEEEMEAGEGGAFPARGGHGCQERVAAREAETPKRETATLENVVAASEAVAARAPKAAEEASARLEDRGRA